MKNYDHKKIEKKWQREWDKNETYKTLSNTKMKKMYVLDMFPYPSGVGLHVGHPRGYIGSDVYARMKRMEGYNVLHPMGYDAFGLPAEQYALEHKIHPKKAVEENVKTFERQLSIMGLSYDWSRKVNTTDPKYYKWTQWIFLQIYNSYFNKTKNKACPITELEALFEKDGNSGVNAVCSSDTEIFTAKDWKSFSKKEKQDILMKYRLAYEGYSDVNWCKELGTVLANDEVVNDKDGNPVSERGGYKVEKKLMRQWFMRITAYADRLLNGLDDLEWSDHIKEIQKNWIGKSEGSEIEFKVQITKIFSSGPRAFSPDHSEKFSGDSNSINIFTTRADTIFGATYVVLAPEHSLVKKLKSNILNWTEVENYINKIKNKTDKDRTKIEKEKTGVELKGVKSINPANKEEIPIWIADYVLASYGTGAVMAVPAHDERDNDFAVKFNLPIIDKPLVEAKEIIKKVEGKMVTKYKMRDAIFARQRYWGEPIPLIHDKDGIITELKEEELPLELPNVKSYASTGTGESPLGGVKSWTKKGYETNTMPGWAGSSWYFLRYMDPSNTDQFAGKEEMEYWKDVDVYVGGQEHATGHLLYSRFWNNFLFDLDYIPSKEPFTKLINQGMILANDGRKMSKRWGNVINPDDIVENYGADTLRVYEMFMGPFRQSLPWSTESIIGSRRFIDRIYRLQDKINEVKSREEIEKILNKTIKKVSQDIENFAFNTSISSMMILLNQMEKEDNLSINDFKLFLQILAPFAPYITEELWYNLGEKESIHISSWPKYDEKKTIDESVKIIIQINGKVRSKVIVDKDISEEEVKNLALKDINIIKWIGNNQIKRIIYIPSRIINIVV